MSSTRLTSLMTVGAWIFVAPFASAQGPAPLERGYGHVNLGLQATSHDLEQDTPFVIYDEPGRIQANGSGGGGVLFDIGGGYRVWQRVYAGLSFTSGSNTEDAALSATVPHPFFFDEFRTVTGTTPALKHSEQALHLQAMWRIPVTTRFDVLLGGGPTFFWVDQDLVSGITVTEIGNPTTGVNLSGVTVERASESTVGYNLGADGTYLLTQRFGVGGFLR
ncbi:MAG TPA: hypothetical protein VE505_12260, partial [Vicinamibacterales bacterium]|nr:hypothetical protein [Vicinamibacterales bacterium]